MGIDGRIVAFLSEATNLVPKDFNNTLDIFVHDRDSGQTTRVSVSDNGSEGNDDSYDPKITLDGRLVVFTSLASNLVPRDTNRVADIFVHNRQTGKTTRVSVESTGMEANNRSADPTITADGRFVAFRSSATNLVAGDTNGGSDIFVHDRQTGETTRVSVSSDDSQANGASFEPDIGDDGRFVAFSSKASNLVVSDTNGETDVFLHDRQTGETILVSVDSTGLQGNKDSDRPVVSPDGLVVAFDSLATNLVVGDTNRVSDIFVHVQPSGSTFRVSVKTSGAQGTDRSWNPDMSDGRLVAFNSNAKLIVDDTNKRGDVYLHDRRTGITTRESTDSKGGQGNGKSIRASLSADGSAVAFGSRATNLVHGDTNGVADIFVHQLAPPTDHTFTSGSRASRKP